MSDVSLRKRRTVLEIGIVVVLMALSASIASAAATGASAAPSSSPAYTNTQQIDPPMPPVPYAVGDVFVGVGTGIIKQFNSTGTLKDILNTTTGCAEDLGMAFDNAGNLYATAAFGSCFGAGTVSKFDNMGNLTGPFGSGYSASTESVVINAAQDVFIGQPDGTKQLLEFYPNGTLKNSFSPATENRGTDWNDLAADQCTMYYTSEGTHVKRFNVCTNTSMTDFNTAPLPGPFAFALRILPTGEVIVADSDRVILLNSSGGLEKTYAAPTDPGFDFLFALNIDPDGSHFWTASYGGGKVYEYNFSNTTGPIFEFDPVKLGHAVSGLTIFGEHTVAQKPLGSISGMKFNDLNANGIKDVGEPGLANWTITLTNQTGGMITTMTDASGNYSFTNLTNGNYTVGEVLQAGWVQTAPATGTYTVSITSGAAITGDDFGNFHKGDITGGGWINITGDPKATFGIVGHYPDSSNTAQGSVEYQDHNASLNIKSINITTVATTLDKKKGVITGLAQVNGAGSYPFVVYVEDNAEPGKGADVFNISLPTYPYSNGAILSGGNIQIHS